jgi:hypothetical protein
MTARPTARPFYARVLVLTVATIAVVANSCGANQLGSTQPPTPTDGPAAVDITADTLVGETTTTATPTTTIAKVPLGRTIARGDKGDDVKMVQERLNALKFDVGAADGIFGDNTRAAVWAYQDLLWDPRSSPKRTADGKVTPELWDRMQDPFLLQDWRPNGGTRHVLISLPLQVMVVWNAGQVEVITHISSGSGKEWCEEPKNVPAWPGATTTTNPAGRLQKICGKSITPGGVFRIYMKRAGKAEIPLGTVFDPLYFNKGIAIHGFDEVPFSPASHGCVRVPRHIGTRLFNVLKKDDRVFVFDGAKDPETYGAQPPPDDFPDPNDTEFIDATSTTSSTSTTTTTTTTTVPTTATTPKPTTTTTVVKTTPPTPPTTVATTVTTPKPTTTSPSTTLPTPSSS